VAARRVPIEAINRVCIDKTLNIERAGRPNVRRFSERARCR
jgi:hypothetical protein